MTASQPSPPPRCIRPFLRCSQMAFLLTFMAAASMYLSSMNASCSPGSSTMSKIAASSDTSSHSVAKGTNQTNAEKEKGLTNEIQRVFVWPAGYPYKNIGELRQILRDGIDRSSKLEQTFDIDEVDAIFAVDFFRTNFNCDSVEALLQDSLDRRAGNLIRKVVLFDFSDWSQKDSWRCLERLSNLEGMKGRVEYACRQFWEGRNISLTNKSIAEPFGSLGTPRNFSKWEGYGDSTSTGKRGAVHLLRYPIRSDMVRAMEEIIQSDYPSNLTTETNRITLPRPIDVASFSPVGKKIEPSQNLRGYVSEWIEILAEKNSNLTVHVGVKGTPDETGRSTPQNAYMKAMLESKIVVTAQRDHHEDHYRFFEAILSGALVMTDPMHPLPLGYVNGTNVVVYNSLKELEDQMSFYLINPNERWRIARAGYKLAMEEHRSWNVVERVLIP